MKTITVTRICDKTVVANLSVSSEQDAHEYFSQQYDYNHYDYSVSDAEIIPAYEFATH